FRSPVAAQLLGGDGVIRGKDALLAYWAEGLRRQTAGPFARRRQQGAGVLSHCWVSSATAAASDRSARTATARSTASRTSSSARRR
ncbi:hypothetical protein ACWDZ8_43765, partial [Streptomyces sp. NPDC003233]